MHEGCIRAGSSGTNTKDARSELEMHCHAASFILQFQVRGKRRAMGRGRGGWKALDADDTKPGKSEQAWDYDGMGRTSEMPVRSPYIRRIEDACRRERKIVRSQNRQSACSRNPIIRGRETAMRKNATRVLMLNLRCTKNVPLQ